MYSFLLPVATYLVLVFVFWIFMEWLRPGISRKKQHVVVDKPTDPRNGPPPLLWGQRWENYFLPVDKSCYLCGRTIHFWQKSFRTFHGGSRFMHVRCIR